MKKTLSKKSSDTVPLSSVVDPDPRSGAFFTLDPGSVIQNRFFPDPRSRIQDFGSPNPMFLIA